MAAGSPMPHLQSVLKLVIDVHPGHVLVIASLPHEAVLANGHVVILIATIIVVLIADTSSLSHCSLSSVTRRMRNIGPMNFYASRVHRVGL